MSSDPEMRVIDIPAERVDEAAAVLAAAFWDYPMMGWFFAGAGEKYGEHLTEMCRLSCELRLLVGWPLLGVEIDGKLAGVACVATAEDIHDVPELPVMEERLMARVGPEVEQRFEAYAKVKDANLPAGVHWYLTMIGVDPACHGKGCGGVLLRRIHEMVAADSTVTGIGLDTQAPANVALYEHFGYEITAKTMVGDVDMWCMFRPSA
jgi:GNAT superfamily N-acetyltransferase